MKCLKWEWQGSQHRSWWLINYRLPINIYRVNHVSLRVHCLETTSSVLNNTFHPNKLASATHPSSVVPCHITSLKKTHIEY